MEGPRGHCSPKAPDISVTSSSYRMGIRGVAVMHSRTWSPHAHRTRPKAPAPWSRAEHGAGSPAGRGSVTGGLEEPGQRGRGLPLAWPGGFSGRAHTCTSRSEGSRSSRRSVRRPLSGKGRGAMTTGSWGQGLVLRALGSRQPPCPHPYPALGPPLRACAGTPLRRGRPAGRGAATRHGGCRAGCPGTA